jgi:hypothetical protein
MNQYATLPNFKKLRTYLDTFLKPNKENSLAVKLLCGLRLGPEDIMEALRSPFPNPLKSWLLEVIFCYLRLIWNREAMVLRQIMRMQKQQEEFAVMLAEWQELVEYVKARALFHHLNREAVARRFEEIKQKELSCYQHQQLRKASDLEFWRRIVKDERQFAKVLLAVTARYSWLAKGEQQVRIIEAQLSRGDLPSWERMIKEERVQAFKDHQRLASMENLQKFIPDIVGDAAKAVYMAQTMAVNEEFYVKSFEDAIEATNEEPLSNELSYKKITKVFSNSSTNNEFEDLAFDLDIICNRHNEYDLPRLTPVEASLYKLLDLFREYKKMPSEDLRKVIYLQIQSSIDALGTTEDYSQITKCLKKWQYREKQQLSAVIEDVEKTKSRVSREQLCNTNNKQEMAVVLECTAEIKETNEQSPEQEKIGQALAASIDENDAEIKDESDNDFSPGI